MLRQDGWSAEPVALLFAGSQGLEALAEHEPDSVLTGEFLALARRLDALRLLAQGDAGSALERIEAARGRVSAQVGERSVRFRTVGRAVRIGETHGQVRADLGREDASRESTRSRAMRFAHPEFQDALQQKASKRSTKKARNSGFP